MKMVFNKKLSVIVPCYNEAKNIKNTIKEILKTLKPYTKDIEIIVVDDGSSDNSYEEAKSIKSRYVKVVKNPKNLGKGYSLKNGFRYASGEYIAFIDADLEIHPRHLIDFMKIMKKQKADVVIGSKRHEESKVNYSKIRKIISNIYFLFIKLFFSLPIKDTQTGLKLFKRKALEDSFYKTTIKRWAYDLELLVSINAGGYSIASAPIEINPIRHFGFIKLSVLLTTFIDTIRVLYRRLIGYYNRSFPSKRIQPMCIFTTIEEKEKLLEISSNLQKDDSIIVISPKKLPFKIRGIKVIKDEISNINSILSIMENRCNKKIACFIDKSINTSIDFFLARYYLNDPQIDIAYGPMIAGNLDLTQNIAYNIFSSRLTIFDKHHLFRMSPPKTTSYFLPFAFFIKKSSIKKIKITEIKFIYFTNIKCKYTPDARVEINSFSSDLLEYPAEFFYQFASHTCSGILRHFPASLIYPVFLLYIPFALMVMRFAFVYAIPMLMIPSISIFIALLSLKPINLIIYPIVFSISWLATTISYTAGIIKSLIKGQ